MTLTFEHYRNREFFETYRNCSCYLVWSIFIHPETYNKYNTYILFLPLHISGFTSIFSYIYLSLSSSIYKGTTSKIQIINRTNKLCTCFSRNSIPCPQWGRCFCFRQRWSSAYAVMWFLRRYFGSTVIWCKLPNFVRRIMHTCNSNTF